MRVHVGFGFEGLDGYGIELDASEVNLGLVLFGGLECVLDLQAGHEGREVVGQVEEQAHLVQPEVVAHSPEDAPQVVGVHVGLAGEVAADFPEGVLILSLQLNA